VIHAGEAAHNAKRAIGLYFVSGHFLHWDYTRK